MLSYYLFIGSTDVTGSKPGLVRLKDLLAFIDIHWRQLRKNQYD